MSGTDKSRLLSATIWLRDIDVTRLEVVGFEVLVGQGWINFAVPQHMDLAILANHTASLVGEDRAIITPLLPAFVG